MDRVRSLGRVGLAAGRVMLGAGLALVGGSAIAAGDWWLAQQPWIGVGLTLLVVGLALTAIFGVLLVAAEPLGSLRLLAIPPAILVGLMWVYWIVFGLATTGPGGPERDIATMLYSLPSMVVVAVIATLLIALPLAVVWFRSARTPAVR